MSTTNFESINTKEAGTDLPKEYLSRISKLTPEQLKQIDPQVIEQTVSKAIREIKDTKKVDEIYKSYTNICEKLNIPTKPILVLKLDNNQRYSKKYEPKTTENPSETIAGNPSTKSENSPTQLTEKSKDKSTQGVMNTQQEETDKHIYKDTNISSARSTLQKYYQENPNSEKLGNDKNKWKVAGYSPDGVFGPSELKQLQAMENNYKESITKPSNLITATPEKTKEGKGFNNDEPMSTEGKSQRDIQIEQSARKFAKEFNVDYKLLLAIAQVETAMGTTGAGRPGKDIILGYGVHKPKMYRGIDTQMEYGAKRISEALASKGNMVTSKQDVAYLEKGGDLGNGYKWSGKGEQKGWVEGVRNEYQKLGGGQKSFQLASK